MTNLNWNTNKLDNMKELKQNTLPKKWAIQTDRQEFFDWVNKCKISSDCEISKESSDLFIHIPHATTYGTWSGEYELAEGYELITFETWASVHRPELVNTPEIPERWCVRRTPKIAKLLNEWCNNTKGRNWSNDTYCWVRYDGQLFTLIERSDCKEITFERWQTIPEVAEWIYVNCQFFWDMNAAKRVLKLKPSCKINTEKLQEREIIGYEAPRDLFGKRIKAGTVFTKCKITTVSFEYIHGQTILPAEIVETWKPVYAKPVFKVGDWVTFEDLPTKKTFNIDEIDPITEFDGTQRVISAGINYSAKCCRLATPEEIEAARPKRKYMKQVWYGLVMDTNLKPIATSEPFYSESEANEWVLRTSEEGKVYSVKPFEVVAYE